MIGLQMVSVSLPVEWQALAWLCFIAGLCILASFKAHGLRQRVLTAVGVAATMAVPLFAYAVIWVPDCADVPWWIPIFCL